MITVFYASLYISNYLLKLYLKKLSMLNKLFLLSKSKGRQAIFDFPTDRILRLISFHFHSTSQASLFFRALIEMRQEILFNVMSVLHWWFYDKWQFYGNDIICHLYQVSSMCRGRKKSPSSAQFFIFKLILTIYLQQL